MADLVAEFEAIRLAARDPEADPHRIQIPDSGAFAAVFVMIDRSWALCLPLAPGDCMLI